MKRNMVADTSPNTTFVFGYLPFVSTQQLPALEGTLEFRDSETLATTIQVNTTVPEGYELILTSANIAFMFSPLTVQFMLLDIDYSFNAFSSDVIRFDVSNYTLLAQSSVTNASKANRLPIVPCASLRGYVVISLPSSSKFALSAGTYNLSLWIFVATTSTWGALFSRASPSWNIGTWWASGSMQLGAYYTNETAYSPTAGPSMPAVSLSFSLQSVSPTSSPLPHPTPAPTAPPDSHHVHGYAIILIIIGVVFLAGAVFGGTLWFYRRTREAMAIQRKADPQAAEEKMKLNPLK